MSDLRDKARDLRKNMTDAERRLWSHLRNEQLGVRFRRQAPIGPYIADFACFDPRLVIEVDGGQHDEQRGYDTRRDDWLRSQGFLVLRFWNNEVLGNTEGVLGRVLDELKVLRLSTPSPWMGEGWGGGAAQQVTRETGVNPTPHPNPRPLLPARLYLLRPWSRPPQGGREQEDAASLRHLVRTANPPPRLGRGQADSADDPRGES